MEPVRPATSARSRYPQARGGRRSARWPSLRYRIRHQAPVTMASCLSIPRRSIPARSVPQRWPGRRTARCPSWWARRLRTKVPPHGAGSTRARDRHPHHGRARGERVGGIDGFAGGCADQGHQNLGSGGPLRRVAGQTTAQDGAQRLGDAVEISLSSGNPLGHGDQRRSQKFSRPVAAKAIVAAQANRSEAGSAGRPANCSGPGTAASPARTRSGSPRRRFAGRSRSRSRGDRPGRAGCWRA
jgi:hypothetical protein